MPRITNNAGLPEALVKAVENDGYSKGGSDYSTTELSKPSRIVALEKLHADEITDEAADRIYSLVGKLGHSILEHSGTADIIEKRFFWEIDGKTLSGQLDVVEGSIIEDWKFCSIYTAKDGVKPEWISQASVNRYLCEKNGLRITGARYVAIFRDWSKSAAKRDWTYPQYQVQVFPVELWSMEKTETWIKERIRSHESALTKLPLCSDEERWSRGAKFAVMKKGRKRAVKLHDSRDAADKEAAAESTLYVEERKSESIRCELYCSVSKFCQQFQDIQKDQ